MVSGSSSEQALDGAPCFTLDPSQVYAVRVLHSNLGSVSEDRTSGEDFYTVLLWPDDTEREPSVVRRYERRE